MQMFFVYFIQGLRKATNLREQCICVYILVNEYSTIKFWKQIHNLNLSLSYWNSEKNIVGERGIMFDTVEY